MSRPQQGQKITVISKSNIKYEGALESVDQQNNTLTLRNVRLIGTEDRPAVKRVPASDQVYKFIVFRGNDIQHLNVHENSPPTPQDPAIVRMSGPMPGGIPGMPQPRFEAAPPPFNAPLSAPSNNWGGGGGDDFYDRPRGGGGYRNDRGMGKGGKGDRRGGGGKGQRNEYRGGGGGKGNRYGVDAGVVFVGDAAVKALHHQHPNTAVAGRRTTLRPTRGWSSRPRVRARGRRWRNSTSPRCRRVWRSSRRRRARTSGRRTRRMLASSTPSGRATTRTRRRRACRTATPSARTAATAGGGATSVAGAGGDKSSASERT